MERETVFKEDDLLEFVDTDDDSHFVLKRNPLRQIKDVFRSLRQVFDAEPQGKGILRIVAERNFRSKPSGSPPGYGTRKYRASQCAVSRRPQGIAP